MKLIIIIAAIFSFSPLFSQDLNDLEELRKRGEKYRAESNYDSALIAFRQISDLAEERGDIEFQIRSAIGSAAVFFELRDTDLAREYYYKAIDLSQTIDNKRLENNAWYGIGGTHQLDENLDSALFYYNKAKILFEEEENTEMVSSLLANIASIYYSTGEYILAIEKSIESKKINLETKQYRFVGADYRRLGLIYSKLGGYDSAKYFHEKAFELADSMNYLSDAREALISLASLAEEESDFERAYNYRTEAESISRKIFIEGTNDQILDLREKYNTAALELENERQKNLALQQKRYKAIILIVAATLVLTALILLYVMNQRRKNIKALAEKNEEINRQQIDELLQKQEIASLQGVLEGQETERRRVAIDLHDRLGGILSMVKLHFSVVTESLSKDDQAHAKFMKASDLLDQATGEVRSISHNLLSGVLMKFGLVPALEDLKDKISQTGKLKVTLYSNELNNVLSAEQELQLYRIVQELISNILKHSQAKEANIQLTKGDESVNLIVEDDGIGFDLKAVNKKTGIGLSNLKARVAKLNGNFHIDSGRGAGTTISIDIPIHHD
tara:strand:+ start:62304 stop:63986 length:1683 start_codon:yes stop_codon:yes gene_type:complete